jgi:3-hydroxybutyryl-CoA dehydratase
MTIGLGKSINELELGESAEQSKTITETDISLYAGITGDFNPMHVNEEYAKTTRFGGRIAHGGLVEGLIAPVVGIKLPGPGTIALERSVRFKAPTKIGDTITAKAEVAEKIMEKNIVVLKCTWTNQRGEVIMEGTVKCMPPKKS